MKILGQILEEIEEMSYPSERIGCGLEDVGIIDRYEAAAYGWNEAVERIAEIIRSHMEDDGWIPVEKALPEKYCTVWLSFTNRHCSYSRKAYWDGRNFRWCSNGIKVKERPMAWQQYYTPEPYRPKED